MRTEHIVQAPLAKPRDNIPPRRDGVTLVLVGAGRGGYIRPAWNGAGLAQLVEHLICNQGVTGSNPVAGTIFFADLAKICPVSPYHSKA